MWPWSESWKRWYRRTLPTYWVYIFCGTHLPGPKIPTPVPNEDKVIHFVMYALLAFLYWRFGETFRRPVAGWFFWVGAALLILYGGIDEYLQGFVRRGPSWGDWIADAAGVLLVLTVFEVRRRRLIARAPLLPPA